jgi:hypothetical protein
VLQEEARGFGSLAEIEAKVHINLDNLRDNRARFNKQTGHKSGAASVEAILFRLFIFRPRLPDNIHQAAKRQQQGRVNLGLLHDIARNRRGDTPVFMDTKNIRDTATLLSPASAILLHQSCPSLGSSWGLRPRWQGLMASLSFRMKSAMPASACWARSLSSAAVNRHSGVEMAIS